MKNLYKHQTEMKQAYKPSCLQANNFWNVLGEAKENPTTKETAKASPV